MNSLRFRDLSTNSLAFRGLAALVRARKPHVVYLDSDPHLYEEWTPEGVAALFGAVAASRCRVVIRTERPDRAREWMRAISGYRWAEAPGGPAVPIAPVEVCLRAAHACGVLAWPIARKGSATSWPLPNLTILAVVRTQADVARLADRPDCAVWGAWCEPTEALDLTAALRPIGIQHPFRPAGVAIYEVPGLNWVVMPKRADRRFAGDIRRQCVAGGVRCFCQATDHE